MSVRTVDFKPSQINPFRKHLGKNNVQVSAIPFIATFNHAESEVFAAMMVLTLARGADVWAPVEPKQIGQWMKSFDEETTKEWNILCMARPHPHTLVKEGFVRFVGENTDDKGAPLEFTALGLEKLAKWVRP